MRKIGLGITFGACLVAVLVWITGKDLFNCGLFVMGLGILLILFSKN